MKKEITKYKVVKHNDFILKASYKLTSFQMRFVILICSLIRKNDLFFERKELDLSWVMECLGWESNPSMNSNYIETKLVALAKHPIYLETSSEIEICPWFKHFKLNKETKKICYQLNDVLEPYFLKLKSNFTKLKVTDVLKLRSFYSIRLYELLMCYYKRSKEKEVIITIDTLDLTRLLASSQADKISFSKFNRVILKPALEELRLSLSLNITCAQIKGGKGKKVTALQIRISG